MKRFGKIAIAAFGAAVAMLSPVSQGHAAPPAIDPDYQTVNNYWQSAGTASIFPNRNQLMIRLTGREYAEHATGPMFAHYPGSGMAFVEDLVNGKIINATSDSTDGTVAATPQVNSELFQNYVDLIVKRLLDADQRTPLDYDTQTFAYVDATNPALSRITSVFGSNWRDVNGDGNRSAYEVAEVLGGICLTLPIIDLDVCLNMFIVGLGNTSLADFTAQSTITAPWNALAQSNNPGARMIDFDGYSAGNVTDSSHLLIASYPNRTFDNELNGCTSPKDTSAPGACDPSAYRDDDDGLFLEIQLKNFAVDLLFQPPVTTSVTEYVGHAGIEMRNDPTPASPINITDIEDATTMTALALLPDYIAGPAGNEPARPMTQEGLTNIPGCPQYVVGDDYDPACDLSTYVKAYGRLFVPTLRIKASIQIISSYTDLHPDANGYVTDTINLGIVAQKIEFLTNFALTLNAGPFCRTGNAAITADGLGEGQDGVGVYYNYSDNPNNCTLEADGDGVRNDSDDSTYLVSTQLVAILPYVRAEIEAKMEDFFSPTSNPGYFFGPTRLLDLNSILGDVTFDIPWEYNGGDTDYVNLQLSLDSQLEDASYLAEYRQWSTKNGAPNVIGDSLESFWADWNGVSLPFNLGLGLDWFDSDDKTTRTRISSCVQTDSAFTGYIDGYENSVTGTGDEADDPSVSKPLPRLKTAWTGYNTSAWNDGSSERYDADLLGRKIPDVNGVAPFVGPNRQAVPDDGNPEGSYAFGLALHQNVLSKAIYEAVIDGILCIEIDPRDPNNFLGDTAGSILNTSLWGFFIPYLADNYPDMDMALRILPTVQNPDRSSAYKPDEFNSPSNYASKLREFRNNYFNYSAGVTYQNPIPRIITGGLNIYNPLKDRYAGAITTDSDLFSNPVTTDPNILNPLADNGNYGLWPDLSIIIPHLVLEWFVWDTRTATPIKRRVFALDIGVNIALNIDITQDPGVTGNPSPLDSYRITDQTIAPGDQFARPAYTGTNFPIGCGPTVAYPCEINNVPSRLVVFLGGLLDPEVNAVLVYDEMSRTVTDGTVGAVAPNNSEAFLASGTTDFTAYENAISNLLGMILSSEISFMTEIGLDPAAYLNLPLVLTVPYIGPSFVGHVTGATNFADNRQDLGCGTNGDQPCVDPLGSAPASGFRDVSDNDVNGFGDYLIVAAGVDLSYLKSDYLFRLIDSAVEPLLNSNCEDAAVVCQSELYNGSLNELLRGFAPAAEQQQFGGIQLPQGYTNPKTYIKGVEKAHATETIIAFEGELPGGDSTELTYAWRVDGGLWTPFMDWTRVRVPGLLEGKHTFEVKAKDAKGNVEYNPARIEFLVDSVAPRVTIGGDRVQDTDVQFDVAVRDSFTSADNVRVSYRVNGGEWSRYSFNKTLELDLAEGRHTLEVRAIDEAGNVSVPEALTFSVEDSGFGCSASRGSAADLLILLVAPALLMLRRRSRLAA